MNILRIQYQSRLVLDWSQTSWDWNWFQLVLQPMRTTKDQSTPVQSGLLWNLDFEEPVLVPVSSPGKQKTRLDWTFKHYLKVLWVGPSSLLQKIECTNYIEIMSLYDLEAHSSWQGMSPIWKYITMIVDVGCEEQVPEKKGNMASGQRSMECGQINSQSDLPSRRMNIRWQLTPNDSSIWCSY